MPKAISIFLFLALGIAPAAPLLALQAQASSPACCRRDGKHGCMKPVMHAAIGKHSETTISSLPAKCPQCPKNLDVDSPLPLGFESQSAVFAELVAHPASAAQTKAKRTISHPVTPKARPSVRRSLLDPLSTNQVDLRLSCAFLHGEEMLRNWIAMLLLFALSLTVSAQETINHAS